LIPLLVCAALAAVLPEGRVCAQSPALTNQAPAATSASTPPAKAFAPDPKKAKRAYEKGLQAEGAQDWQAAFEAYIEAAERAPKERDYLLHRELARSRLVQQHVDNAERFAVTGDLTGARNELRVALGLDPSDSVARERLQDFSEPPSAQLHEVPPKISGEIRLQHGTGTRSFDYRSNTQGAYEEVARQFGVRAAFDVDLHPRPVRLRVTDVDFETAMRVLGDMTNTFWRPLTSRMFFVAPDTPQKRRDYDATVVRTILLPESVRPDNMTEMLRLVREIVGITRADLDTNSRTITLRDSPRNVALAEKLLSELEQTPGELILEIEILEVNRDVAHNLGITPPESSRIVTLSSQDITEAQQSVQGLINVLTRLFGLPSSLNGLSSSQIASLISAGQVGVGSLIPPLVAFGGGRTTFLATMPGATATFSNALSLIQSGRRVLLRAKDGQPATFFVGDRFPITLATLSNSLGSATFVPGVSSAAFPRTDFAVGNSPVALVTGSFNSKNNSHIDIAVANHVDSTINNQAQSTISLLLGNGDGTFQTQTVVDLPAGSGPSALVAADFNSDSFLDLAVTDQTTDKISILLGNNDGTFQPETHVALPAGSGPVALLSGMFNSKSSTDKIDLAVLNQTAKNVTILLGDGTGKFTIKSTVSTGNKPVAMVSGDFNRDGFLDLAVVNQADNTVTVLLGNGDGTFQPATTARTLTTGNAPAGIATADFNADSILDLAVTNSTDNDVAVFIGNGNGTFGFVFNLPTGAGPAGIITGDFNSDGVPDLAVADQTANAVSILLGVGGGNFAPRLDLTTGNGPVALATADFNGDGRPDLATANEAANTVSVILNSNVFTPPGGLPQTLFPGSEYVDLGLKVKATPRIHPDDEVTLQLQFEIRSVTGQDINGIPVLSNRTIEQTVRLRENETSLLAGLLERDEMRAISGTPGLAELPSGAGQLFGLRTTENMDKELLILITPRMVRLVPRTNRSIYAGREGSKSGPASTQP
jgi:Flp pilus assembly secretin CpaC